MQREFTCCGAYVPDSCCCSETVGCGKDVLTITDRDHHEKDLCPWLHRCDEGQDDHPGQDDPDSVCWCRECSCNFRDTDYLPGM